MKEYGGQATPTWASGAWGGAGPSVLRDDVSRRGGATLDDYLSSVTACFSDRAQLACAETKRAAVLL